MHPVNAETSRNLLSHRPCISRKHYGLRHARLTEVGNNVFGSRLHHITQDDVSGISAADSHMDNRSGSLAMAWSEVHLRHKPLISHRHHDSVNRGRYTFAAYFPDIAYATAVNRLAVCLLQRFGDRMRRRRFHDRGIFEQLRFLSLNININVAVVMKCVYLKHAFSQCSCLVEHNGPNLRQRFEYVGTFHQYSFTAFASDSCEERQRNTDDQSTRATDYEEYEGAVDPCLERRETKRNATEKHKEQGRQEGKGQRSITYDGGIYTGKLGNEILRFRLP